MHDKSKNQKKAENYLFNLFFSKEENGVIFDVGGNVGRHSEKFRAYAPNAQIYSFEPHPKNFLKLKEQAKKTGCFAINVALSDEKNKLKLYDYDVNGSGNASLYQGVIDEIHRRGRVSHVVDVTTIDDFVSKNTIKKITFLKIDTEGNELKVLKGAKKTIKNKQIDAIYFEFNTMNVFSRTFLKDFYDVLEDFKFYRIYQDGIVELGPYTTFNEIFVFHNLFAIRKDIVESDIGKWK